MGFEYSPQLDAAAGPPFVQVSGYAAVGDPITGPRNTYENNLNISGSMTWIHGRHEFKFGGGYGHDQINVLFGIATNGFFVFAPAPINDAFASFLIGQPVLFLQGGGDPSRGLRGNNFNLYAQDSFKATKRLTLNLGLRYDVPSPYTEIHNRQNLFEPGSTVHRYSICAAGPGISGRCGRARRLDPNGAPSLRAAHRSRLGSERQRPNARNRRVRRLLRSLLQRSRRAAPDSEQRATLFADAASQLPVELRRSLQRYESFRRRIRDADDAAHARSETCGCRMRRIGT